MPAFVACFARLESSSPRAHRFPHGVTCAVTHGATSEVEVSRRSSDSPSTPDPRTTARPSHDANPYRLDLYRLDEALPCRMRPPRRRDARRSKAQMIPGL